MKQRLVPTEYQPVVEWLLPQLLPRRKMTIAIDGVDHAGKSSLGRFLAWQSGIPVIETDFTLTKGPEPAANAGLPVPVHDGSLLLRLIERRHKLDRPVLVEGVFVLRQLDAIGMTPDLLIEMRATGVNGSWRKEFAAYRQSYPRTNTPDFVVTRLADDA